jgi:hypothetical protein
MLAGQASGLRPVPCGFFALEHKVGGMKEKEGMPGRPWASLSNLVHHAGARGASQRSPILRVARPSVWKASRGCNCYPSNLVPKAKNPGGVGAKPPRIRAFYL